MKVVLFQSVPNLGLAGQSVDVKPGYFRNYLEPRGFAMQETASTLRLLAARKKKIDAQLLKEKGEAETVARQLEGITLTFTLKAGEKGRLFGSVTASDIAKALAEKGITIDRHKIELTEALKTVGPHHARARLYPGVAAELAIVIEAEARKEDEISAEAKAAAEADDAHAAANPAPEDEGE